MAFLFHDQNQGIRNDAPPRWRLSRPFSFIRTLTVGFGIAPNLLTLFLPGDFRENEALAGLGLSHLPPVESSALRTTAALYEQPAGSMAKRGCAIKNLRQGNPYFPITKPILPADRVVVGSAGQGKSW
jgi:hypothetical protein